MSKYSGRAQSALTGPILHPIPFVGGSTAVTKEFGLGVTVTYISTGVVDLVWAENPGTFIGLMGFHFSATTQSGVKGWTVVSGDYSTTTFTLRLNITNSSDTLADLSSTQHLAVLPAFKTVGV